MPGLIETPALHPIFFIDDKVLSKCPQNVMPAYDGLEIIL